MFITFLINIFPGRNNFEINGIDFIPVTFSISNVTQIVLGLA